MFHIRAQHARTLQHFSRVHGQHQRLRCGCLRSGDKTWFPVILGVFLLPSSASYGRFCRGSLDPSP
eukprot:3823441-Heterocapsa_arctica.AAC.1